MCGWVLFELWLTGYVSFVTNKLYFVILCLEEYKFLFLQKKPNLNVIQTQAAVQELKLANLDLNVSCHSLTKEQVNKTINWAKHVMSTFISNRHVLIFNTQLYVSLSYVFFIIPGFLAHMQSSRVLRQSCLTVVKSQFLNMITEITPLLCNHTSGAGRFEQFTQFPTLNCHWSIF